MTVRFNRRLFLGGAVVSVGVAPATGSRAASVRAAAAWSKAQQEQRDRSPDSVTLPLVGATVVAVHRVRSGAMPVVVEYQGERMQIDVMRREGAVTRGVVELGAYAYYVHNDGRGDEATGVRRELAARALALALEQHPASARAFDQLLTFDERAARFPEALFGVDLGTPTRA